MKKSLSNNKGFSLVELIIVIAIMAVLIGILAPQYLRYVEKSKTTQDENLVEDLRTAIETACADPDSDITEKFTMTITDAGTSHTSTSTFLDQVLPTDYKNGKLQSKKYKAGVTITVEFDDQDNDGVQEPVVTDDMDRTKGSAEGSAE